MWTHDAIFAFALSSGPSTGLYSAGPVVSAVDSWCLVLRGFPSCLSFSFGLLTVSPVVSSCVVSSALTLRQPPALSVPRFGGGPL